MQYLELILIGFSLAMDAFAVSVCQGVQMKKVDFKQAFVIAFLFGLFQALMPLIGYFIGDQFIDYIASFDHWVVFAVLGAIGFKMIYDGIFKKNEQEKVALNDEGKLSYKTLILLAIATSIDALAVGVTFSMVGYNIWLAVSIVGIITLLLCLGAVYIGHFFGDKLKNKAEIIGGVVLVLIGLKILLEHLGVLSF